MEPVRSSNRLLPVYIVPHLLSEGRTTSGDVSVVAVAFLRGGFSCCVVISLLNDNTHTHTHTHTHTPVFTPSSRSYLFAFFMLSVSFFSFADKAIVGRKKIHMFDWMLMLFILSQIARTHSTFALSLSLSLTPTHSLSLSLSLSGAISSLFTNECMSLLNRRLYCTFFF